MSGRTVKLWSCVGSAGTVNPPDLAKVVCLGSIAQLGLGTGRVTAKSPQVAGGGAGPQMQAVIRYGITTVADTWPNPIPRAGLEILCRPGGGQIAARLVQVSMGQGPAPSVAETTLLDFHVQPADRNPNVFYAPGDSAPSVFFDFSNNVYYVEVVLTAPADVVIDYPPAVAAIQLYFLVD